MMNYLSHLLQVAEVHLGRQGNNQVVNSYQWGDRDVVKDENDTNLLLSSIKDENDAKCVMSWPGHLF